LTKEVKVVENSRVESRQNKIFDWFKNLFKSERIKLTPIESAATRKIGEVKNLQELLALLKFKRMHEYLAESGLDDDLIKDLPKRVEEYVLKGEHRMHSLQDIPLVDGLRRKVWLLRKESESK